VSSQGWPGGFGGESGNVVVGLVELCDGLRSNKLFGCDVEGVGVTLDRLKQPRRCVIELAPQCASRDRHLVAGKDLLQSLGRGGWGNHLRSDEGAPVAVADDLNVEVVGLPSAGEHRVQLLPGLSPSHQAVRGVGGDALSTVNGGGVTESG
jgi:hypothetical protein